MTNVGRGERIASVAAGSMLTLLGVSRRGLSGAVTAAAGAALAYRGATGHCALYEALGVHRARGAKESGEHTFDVSQAITISVAPEKLYSFWRDLSRLP